MRIGQLARRLGISPSDIVEFVGNQDVDMNSRLSEDLVVRVINRFAPNKMSEILTPSPEEPVEETMPVVEVKEEVIEEIASTPVSTTDEPVPEMPLEVIRVSKVELQGLKVLGKIDLPAPKKKTETTSSEQSEEQPKREFQRRSDRRDREWKNPLETKRLHEQREKERKKQEHAEKEKEKRTNHYFSKVKSVPTKAVRRFEDQTVIEDIEIKERPKGLVGRFLYWLRN